jgi:metallo-beta-lactamase family protein
VPAFAVARAQLVTLILREAMKAGDLPEVPVHIDSPMAVNATKLYSKYLDEENLDPELAAEGRERLFPRMVHFHRSVQESKDLNRMDGPRVIISASGMLTAGRVLHHLKRLLPDRKNLVLLVGYQAAGTRGRALLEGAKSLRMHGRDVPVRAQHLVVHGLSAHADRSGLLHWVKASGKAPKAVFVVHGELESASAFAELLEKEVGAGTFVPELGDAYDLGPLLR